MQMIKGDIDQARHRRRVIEKSRLGSANEEVAGIAKGFALWANPDRYIYFLVLRRVLLVGRPGLFHRLRSFHRAIGGGLEQ